MIKLFDNYKSKKKQKYEKIIKSHITFNQYQINKYKVYPNKVEKPIDEYEQETCICECYSYDFLQKLHKKYNVDMDLIMLALDTEREALEENRNMDNRIKEIKTLEEEREKINLYKKAILELKKEGKI